MFVIDLGREVYKILCQILIWPFGLAGHCGQCSDILRLASLANVNSLTSFTGQHLIQNIISQFMILWFDLIECCILSPHH